MKRIIMSRALGAICIAATVAGANAANFRPLSSIKVLESDVQKSETKLILSSTLDVDSLRGLKSNHQVWIRPVIYSNLSADSLALPDFCLAGHNRYILLRRQAHNEAEREAILRSSSYTTIPVNAVLDYQPWMDDAHVEYLTAEEACRNCLIDTLRIPGPVLDFVPRVFEVAEWAYITPPAEVKTRQVDGKAYIDFPVNRTELYPDYRRNPEELRAIKATIDVVENDPDVRIDSLSVWGYASPEGPWDNNVRLAKGRTATLIEYIRNLYNFPTSILRQGSTPEDWQGLIDRLRLTDIPNRDAILDIAADNSIEPDARNSKIQRLYPAQYKWILAEIYPALRHSDYTVYYTVKDYTDPAVIGEVMKTNPGKLSMGEMFTYANTLDPNSEEFAEVFDLAVRMFKDNEIANLNAANTALRQGHFDAADRYLAKAGNTPQADYLRGVAAALRQDYTTALPAFERASRAGFKAATDAIDQMRTKKLIPAEK